MAINLQCPRRQHKARDTARIAGPPDRRPHDTQVLRLDQNICGAVRETRERIPDTNAIDGGIGDTSVCRKKDCKYLVRGTERISNHRSNENKHHSPPATNNVNPSTEF